VLHVIKKTPLKYINYISNLNVPMDESSEVSLRVVCLGGALLAGGGGGCRDD